MPSNARTSRRRVVAAVLLAVLAATAPAVGVTDAEQLVAATDDYVVGAQHNSTTDFKSGTLQNMSAESGAVQLNTQTTANPVDTHGDGTADGSNTFIGDDGGDNPISAEVKIQPEDTGTITEVAPRIEGANGKDYGFTVDVYIVEEGPDETYGEGTLVRSDWDPDFETGRQPIDISGYDVDAGTTYTIEFVTSGSDNDGNDDRLFLYSDTSASSTWYTFSQGPFSQNEYADVEYSVQKSGTGRYVSANLSTTNAAEAALNVTEYNNVTATYRVEYFSNGKWEVGNKSNITGAGNHSLTLPDVDSETWRTNITVESSGGAAAWELSDESILFTPHDAQADNLSPPDGKELQSEDVDFSVDVSDSDFPTAQGDNVTAELYLDGQSVYSETVSSNTTVTTTQTISDGGDHDYYWELTDDYGGATTTTTRTLTVPNTLYLYSETVNTTTGNHELLNDTNTSVEVTITGSAGSVKSVSVTDGMVDMTGLPADESYVFTIDPDGYYPREVYVESIYDQSAVFLLNQNKTAVENSLTVTDRTNQFPDPIITVERVINTSNVLQTSDDGSQWTTIGGDRLGASGFYIVNLQQSSRYRFVVINQQGDERVLGEYTAKADGEVPLEIGSINYDLGPSNNLYQWTTDATNESGTSPAVSFAYADGANQTEWVNVTFRYRNNSKIIASSNFTNAPYGELQYTEPLNESEYNNREFIVEWEAERNGTVISAKRVVGGGQRTLAPPLADVWMEIAYAAGVFLLAFLVGAGAGAPAAAVTVSVFAALAVFMGLAPPALGFGATILSLFLSVTMVVSSAQEPV